MSFALCATTCTAAEIRVFSELARVGLDGEVIAADRGTNTKPREILSPAIARNAFSSFHVHVDVTHAQKWTFFVGQNPDKALDVTLYREVFENGGPARLEPVSQPVEGTGPAVIWMDLWAARNATVQRVKIEPEMQVEGVADWITYPMEVRVQSAIAREPLSAGPPTTTPGTKADAAGIAMLTGWLCRGRMEGVRPEDRTSLSVQAFLARNAAQDSVLMKALDDERWLWLQTKAESRAAWCKSPARPPGASAEWYLRIRDHVVSQ